jgi:hypothetical protein
VRVKPIAAFRRFPRAVASGLGWLVNARPMVLMAVLSAARQVVNADAGVPAFRK